jgi:hypothetical protein
MSSADARAGNGESNGQWEGGPVDRLGWGRRDEAKRDTASLKQSVRTVCSVQRAV